MIANASRSQHQHIIYRLKTSNISSAEATLRPLTPPSIKSTRVSKPISSNRGQPSPAFLAECGVKVRDFAYESTLTPIKPVLRVPRQIVQGRASLKRSTRDGEDQMQGAKRPRPLEREDTEPAVDELSQRSGGYADLRNMEWPSTIPLGYFSSRPAAKPPPVQCPTNDAFMRLKSGMSSQSQSQSQPQSQLPLYIVSQDPQPYIDTPHVTPNGSLQWPVPDDSSITTLQLDTNLLPREPDILPSFQSGSPSLTQPATSPTVLSSPLSSPRSTASSLPPSNSPGCLRSSATTVSPASISPLCPSLSHNKIPAPQLARSASPRYFLRKRAVTAGSPTRRVRGPHVASRELPVSTQRKKRKQPATASRKLRQRSGRTGRVSATK